MKYIIGNWKMNPKKIDEAKAIVKDIKKISDKAVKNGVQPIICPPNVYLSTLVGLSGNRISLGGQNIWSENNDAETGETSAILYKNLGVKYVIIGHSECRTRGESNELISKKILTAVKSGLKVILCVGESNRDKIGDFYNFVANQLRESLHEFPENKLSNLLIAYEPIWAIGENAIAAATSMDFYEMAMLIRRTLSEQYKKDKAFGVPLLYGGSVDKKNAQSFIDIGADGLLIGRSSIKSKDFVSIIETAISKEIYK